MKKKNPCGRILRDELKEQYLSTVTKSYSYLRVRNCNPSFFLFFYYLFSSPYYC